MWDTSGSQRCKRLRVEMQNYMGKNPHNLTPQNQNRSISEPDKCNPFNLVFQLKHSSFFFFFFFRIVLDDFLVWRKKKSQSNKNSHHVSMNLLA